MTVEYRETPFGFVFGSATVERTCSLSDGSVYITIRTDTHTSVDVYVSPKGRSIRVFDGAKELR